MPRNVSFKSEAVWYAPDIDDNREQEDPFCVLIEPMSVREFRAIEAETTRMIMNEARRKNGIRQDRDFGTDTMRKLITDRVKEVRGYVVQGARGTLEPKNGADLFDAILEGPATEYAILDDIAEALKNISKAEEGLLGKLQPPSNSQQAGIQAGGGVVQSAKAIPAETKNERPEIAMEAGNLSDSNLIPVYENAPGQS